MFPQKMIFNGVSLVVGDIVWAYEVFIIHSPPLLRWLFNN
jgi:hypothetical protein